jgi:hypothetical protein
MGCNSCKKKKVVKLDSPVQEEIWIPTIEEIKLAYSELTSVAGVKEDKKEFINKVYIYLFNEEFIWNCGGCASKQVIRFKNVIGTI